jgi:hypothetical protein
VSRKSRRKADRSPLVEAMKSYVEFPWDYSYFKWQDIPAQVRREMVRNTSISTRSLDTKHGSRFISCASPRFACGEVARY